MNLKKIAAGMSAGAVALAMSSVSAFAQTIEMDAEYPGAWSSSTCISKADLDAIGGDVKITLTVEPRYLIPDQIVLKPMDYDNGWVAVTDYCTSDTAIRKPDGFIYVTKSQTEVEFVISADCISTLGESGLGFQVYNVNVKQAEIEAGSPEAEMRFLGDEFKKEYCMEESTYEELTGDAPAEEAAEETEAAEEETEAPAEETEAPAEETEAPAEETEAPAEETEAAAEETEAEPVPAETEAPVEEVKSDDVADTAPAGDSNTESTGTGNAGVGAIVAVMAAAAVAALGFRKRK